MIFILDSSLFSPKMTFLSPFTNSPMIQEVYPNSFLRSFWNADTLSGGTITNKPPEVSAENPLVSLKSMTSELISVIPSKIGRE